MQLIPVNPKAVSIENDLCYPNLGARPGRVNGTLDGYPPLTYRNLSHGYSENPLLAACRRESLTPLFMPVSGQEQVRIVCFWPQMTPFGVRQGANVS